MPVMDEFKEEREKIKNGSFKDKLRYFWCYYKFHTIAAICAVGLLVLVIHDVVTQKDNAFFAAMLNSLAIDEDAIASMQDDFAGYADINLNEYEVLFDYTMTIDENSASELATGSSQRLLVYTSAGEIDVILGGSDIFPDEANQGMFYDLREILSEEQLAKYEPYFYYVDQAYLDLLDSDEAVYDINYVAPESPDPTKPEEMEEPIPVGIFVTDCEKLNDTFYFSGDYTAVGVMINSSHVETAVQFIDYLFE